MYDFTQLINNIRLSAGAHKSADEGMCAMEFVSWLEGERFSDHPTCTCPVIAAYVRNLNDNMGDTDRQRLLPLLPRIVGTVSPEHEQERAEYLAWQAVRVFAPKALRAAGLHGHAYNLATATTFSEAAHVAAYAAADAAAWVAYAAADAAAYAAADDTAASAADAAARTAARAARTAARAAAWDDAISALEGALAIGKQSPGFSRDVGPVIEEAKITCPA